MEVGNVQQYIDEGDTEENVRASFLKGQYPANNSKYYCGLFYYTLEALTVIKKNGEWIST